MFASTSASRATLPHGPALILTSTLSPLSTETIHISTSLTPKAFPRWCSDPAKADMLRTACGTMRVSHLSKESLVASNPDSPKGLFAKYWSFRTLHLPSEGRVLPVQVLNLLHTLASEHLVDVDLVSTPVVP